MSESQSWSGALPPRKKGELLDLASQLGLEIDSTLVKTEIIDVLKTHLDAHENTLIEDARFKGLYGRKGQNPHRASAVPTVDDSEDSSPAATGPAITAARKRAPKPAARPPSPAGSVSRSAVSRGFPPPPSTTTPSKVPLPPSPVRSLINGLAERVRPEVNGVVGNVGFAKEQFSLETDKALAATKRFLSNSPNISSLTVLWELMVLVVSFIPWKSLPIVVTPPGSKGPIELAFTVPPVETLISRDLYLLIAQWAVPTLDIDPVSSGIVRLACVCSSTWGVPPDLLSVKTRVISAATALAFATAEAIVARSDRGLGDSRD
ncbi:hypothetical protein BS47DRAFT_1339674 [Hydnum rufescens UP504]|uniref:Uncharacterized protein n=1 Tax=Hydnum rufescens UP504 TaxID=1448309 RepID=A0A9P6B4R8_9AGAM|nr:hypothetical protein BS47DRAFT_1339674 [Hydnum rufescens UP504]